MLRVLSSLIAVLICFSAIAEELTQKQKDEFIQHLPEFKAIGKCNQDFLKFENLNYLFFPITCVGKKISWVEVNLEGKAAKKLDKSSLESFIRMRAKNDLGFLPQDIKSEALIFEEINNHYNETTRGILTLGGLLSTVFTLDSLSRLKIECDIWTVGTDYPVAYNIKCRLDSLAHPERVGYLLTKRPIKSEFLGYVASTNLKAEVRNALEMSVQDIAEKWIHFEDSSKALLEIRRETNVLN